MEDLGLPQAAVAGIVSLVLVVCFGILSVVLEHHWNNYEIDAKRRRKARRIYYAGGIGIIVFMLIALIPLLR